MRIGSDLTARSERSSLKGCPTWVLNLSAVKMGLEDRSNRSDLHEELIEWRKIVIALEQDGPDADDLERNIEEGEDFVCDGFSVSIDPEAVVADAVTREMILNHALAGNAS